MYRVTAYCPCGKCCGRWADTPLAHRRTAAGTAFAELLLAWQPFVAGPASLPFGTLVSIPGYAGGRAVPVLDRGGAIGEGRLDVFLPTHDAALLWGVREVEVAIQLPISDCGFPIAETATTDPGGAGPQRAER